MPEGEKYWELIANGLAKDGWSYGVVSFWGKDGQRMHCVDAIRGDGPRIIVHADDLLAGFLEVEAACKASNVS